MIGDLNLRVAVKYETSSSVTSDSSGQPRSLKSGISSLIARGSITAPEMMCDPISRPFSMTAMEISPSCFAPVFPALSLCRLMSWRRRYAPASEAGPAPTNSTSTSRLSRSIFSMGIRWRLLLHIFGSSRQRRDDFKQVADDAVISDFKDRRLLVLVDRDNRARALHPDELLDRARNADGEVEFRRDGLT